ncbi:MAG: HAMP domain-containing histidine kinase [Cyclobacteriaceae bacterium]|nr:HAMP domain-containing histidine kinase [Cyclobacteriaceae bacterium]
MKGRTIRILVIIAVACMIGIGITQIYWFRQAFNAEEDRFNREVNSALYSVARQLFEINDAPVPRINPIQQLSTNYYVVMVNSEIDANLLEYLLITEFEKSGLQADFEYGIYDCVDEKMVYGNYISKSRHPDDNQRGSLPTWADQSYYFGVHFPKKASIITNRMGIWIFSSLVLLVVMVFLGYAIYIILKQKRLSEVQRDFINNMTHEFKTPISTIAVAAQVLKDPQTQENPQRLQNYAHIIETENQRLKNQVERVLTVASLDREAMKKEPVDLHQIIQTSVRSIQVNLQEKDGKVQTDLQAQHSKIHGDSMHLTNVIYNLLDNAIKYCVATPLVSIHTRNHNGSIDLEIRDNGIGINVEEQQKIFHKFYRVPTGNVHDVKGFGLGLNYVQTVVQAHGGTVQLESTPGSGSTFKLTLQNE